LLNALQRKAESALKRSGKSLYGLAAFLFLVGLVFLANLRTDDGAMKTFDILLTTVFWATAIFLLRRAEKPKPNRARFRKLSTGTHMDGYRVNQELRGSHCEFMPEWSA